MKNGLKAAAGFTCGLLLSALPATSALAQAAASTAAPAAAVQAVQAQRAEGVWIDVRSEQEYAQGHLEGAHNVPVDRIAEAIAAISPDKDAPVNLYCRSGRRAEAARKKLEALGYTHVTNHGGYRDLIAKGVR